MNQNKTALIVVDVQRDFLPTGRPAGSLPVPTGDKVATPLRRAMLHHELIVFTQDWHPPDHCSFSDNPQYTDLSWPPHCVQHTRGAEIDTRLLAAAIAQPTFFVEKGYLKNRDAYSGFDGYVHKSVIGSLRENAIDRQFEDLSLAEALDKRGVEEVTVGGLALDYCVKATAIDANRLGFHTTVDLNMTRPVAPETGQQAVNYLLAQNIVVKGEMVVPVG